MDEQVKARLIGATVLVVIAVALVPELLSGPKRGSGDTTPDTTKGTRTVTIDLGGAVASGARVPPVEPAPAPTRETARLTPVDVPGEDVRRDDASAEEALSAKQVTPTATTAPSEPIAPPPAVVAKPAEPVAVKPTVASIPGGWSVQVGAFGSADSARKLVGQLKGDGYSAYVAPLNRNGKTLHRVRVGPTATRADADKLAARIKGRGLPASVVAPD